MDEISNAALEEAVTDAVDAVLGRVTADRRAEALRSLRIELENCLSRAPVTGPAMDALQFRARLAAILAAYEPSPSLAPGRPG